MKGRHGRWGWMALILIVLVGTAGAQGVADLARKNRKKDKPKARIVITNQTLKQVGDKPAKPATVGPDGAPTRVTYQGRNRQYYDRFYKLFQALELARFQFREADARRNHSVAYRLRVKIQNMEKELDARKELARKDGVPPGVVREAHKNATEDLEKQGKITR